LKQAAGLRLRMTLELQARAEKVPARRSVSSAFRGADPIRARLFQTLAMWIQPARSPTMPPITGFELNTEPFKFVEPQHAVYPNRIPPVSRCTDGDYRVG
jgi:hypothetical protein